MLLIMCSHSRFGKGRKLWPVMLDRLRKSKVDFGQMETEYPGHATEIAAANEEIAVAVGGDGMINEVINGVMQREKNRIMGVLYSGTSPDFCKFHNLPVEPGKAVDVILSERSSKIDLVQIEYKDKSGKAATGYFGCSSNIGLGSDVADFSNKYRKYFGDRLGTLFGLIKALLVNKPHDLDVMVDGEKQSLKSCIHIMIIKNPYIASGIKVGLDISADDGKAYVLAIMAKGKMGLLKLLPEFYKGDLFTLKKLEVEGKLWLSEFVKLEVYGSGSVKVEFDGDSKGYLPVKAKIVPGAIELLGIEYA